MKNPEGRWKSTDRLRDRELLGLWQGDPDTLQLILALNEPVMTPG